MTTSRESNQWGGLGNGIAVDFDVDERVQSASHLVVYLVNSTTGGVTTQTQDVQYSVIGVNDDDIWEYDCAAASFAVGDNVGPAKQVGNALEDAKVVATGANELISIGKVVEAVVNATRVKVRVFSKLQSFTA